MSALAHLGANNNSPKQKPTLSRHQNAILATAEGEPYPATSSLVRLLVFFEAYGADSLTLVTNFKGSGRTHSRETPETQGRHIGLFIPEGSHSVKFRSLPLLLPIPLEL